MTLALIDAAGKHRNRAGAVEPDLRAFEAGRRRAFDGVGKAEPAELAVLTRAGAARLEAFAVSGGEREVHVLFKFAAVVSEGHAGLERHRAGRNRIAPAQLRRIDAKLGGGEIDHALDDVT